MEMNIFNLLAIIYVSSMLFVGFVLTFLNDKFDLINMLMHKLQEEDPDDSSLRSEESVRKLVAAMPFIPILNTIFALKFLRTLVNKYLL